MTNNLHKAQTTLKFLTHLPKLNLNSVAIGNHRCDYLRLSISIHFCQ